MPYRSTLILLMILSACGSTNPTKLQHQWGKTRRPNSMSKGTCQNLKTPFNRFLKTLVTKLTQATPTAFSGPFSGNTLCITYNRSNRKKYAEIRYAEKTIYLYRRIIENATTYTQIAAIIAHELAHLTIQRRNPTHPKLRHNSRYKSLQNRFTQATQTMHARAKQMPRNFNAANPVHRRKKQALKKAIAELQQATQKRRGFLAQKIGDGAIHNWREAEADEIGFEYYVRAGFKKEHYSESFVLFMDKLGTGAVQKCRRKLAAIKKGQASINSIHRGSMEHPDPCWRMANILVTEQNSHKNNLSSGRFDTALQRRFNSLRHK